jgi:hypothetical protein
MWVWTHNPLVAGSSPARPTVNRLLDGYSGLPGGRKRAYRRGVVAACGGTGAVLANSATRNWFGIWWRNSDFRDEELAKSATEIGSHLAIWHSVGSKKAHR